MGKVNIQGLTTEKRNERTMGLDNMDIHEFLQIMNDEDAKVAHHVKEVLPQVEKAVAHIIDAFRQGGRLVYVGSGTSGRLGVLDAVECPPTFGTSDEVVGIIAGGESAFVKAKEGAEDSELGGEQDIVDANVSKLDVVVGIAASGRTPHTIGALKKAKAIGAYTVSISCNTNSAVGKVADLAIEMNVGPEVITGSTRLKAGTAQKLVLNMLSTASMVGIGKTYQNLMVDLKPSNEKLVERSIRIIMEAAQCEYDVAQQAFITSDRKVKVAIIMVLLSCEKEEALARLQNSAGFIKHAIHVK